MCSSDLERLGGHTRTHTITNSDGETVNVDMGFIVFNTKNYPLFTQFLHELNVPYHNADMSFGFYDRSKNFWYSSKIPKGIFSQKKNLFSPSFISMLLTINRFNKQALADLNSDVMKELSLGQYLDSLNLSPRFKYHYIYPMGAAIWSCPISEILSFPAYSFFSFWKNHELLTLGKRPQWKTITQGSQSYINAFRSVFSGKILTTLYFPPITRFDRQKAQQLAGTDEALSISTQLLCKVAQKEDSKMLALRPIIADKMDALFVVYYYSSFESMGDIIDRIGMSKEFQNLVSKANETGKLKASNVVKII